MIQPCLLNFTLVWITRTQTFVQEDASRFKQSYRYHHDPRGLPGPVVNRGEKKDGKAMMMMIITSNIGPIKE